MNDEEEALAKEAVRIVRSRFHEIGLNPYHFDSQLALCELLQFADEQPEEDISRWILSADQEKLWKMSVADRMLVEGDDPTHALFREAWQNFLDGNLYVN